MFTINYTFFSLLSCFIPELPWASCATFTNPPISNKASCISVDEEKRILGHLHACSSVCQIWIRVKVIPAFIFLFVCTLFNRNLGRIKRIECLFSRPLKINLEARRGGSVASHVLTHSRTTRFLSFTLFPKIAHGVRLQMCFVSCSHSILFSAGTKVVLIFFFFFSDPTL